jgi:hypothetical protein
MVTVKKNEFLVGENGPSGRSFPFLPYKFHRLGNPQNAPFPGLLICRAPPW